jgi:hypothetical protein
LDCRPLGRLRLFATHPPLEQRIQIVRGAGKKLGTKLVVNGQTVPTFNPIVSTQTSGFATTGLASMNDEIAATNTPPSSTVGEYGALAYLYALLLDPDRSNQQLDYLAQLEEPSVITQIEQIRSIVAIIPPSQRLAALDREIVKIRDTAHIPRLLKCAYGMTDMLPPTNWHTALVYLILHHRLAPTTGTSPAIYHSIDDVWAETINILGTLASSTSHKPQDIAYSFEASLMQLPSNLSSQAKFPPEITWREFETDLSKIAVATLKVKQTVMAACLEILNSHRHIPTEGANLMRSIAILLDCPIPPRLEKLSALEHAG